MNAKNIIKSDFLDILFDGRNKDYGAYELRRSEDRRVRNAIIGTASVALVIIGGYVLSNKLMAADIHKRSEVDIVAAIPEMRDLPPEEKPVTPPPPAVPTPPPPPVSTAGFVSPVVTDDDLVRDEEQMPPRDSLEHKAIGLTNTNVPGGDSEMENPFAGVPGGNGVVEPPKPQVPVDEPPMIFVEIMPEFMGGEDALTRFLRKNIRYPHMAQENGIEGKVFVQFVVNKDGSISDVQTVGAHRGGGLEEEAMRVVKLMPAWKPGRQSGRYVSVRYNLPIGFQLEH